ncbi:UPF0258 protein KIAA1024-like [Oryzias melastigma]|uniref:UPF0258 protein KIAA1024-like n=1 Tax=Oryzias melastigma TaxID=30732 RepID=A0A834F4E5_ORYME|nr:UPF0258 protein KIAA1024-like [Oryzias melastigma]
MDISVFPNSNHPEKFLQLNVGTLGAMQGVFQMGAFMSSQKRWQNGVYSQWEKTIKSGDRGPPTTQDRPVAFVDKHLEKHITPFTLTSNIKTNPLYSDTAPKEDWETEKPKPSWTIKEYDTQAIHRHLSNYLKSCPVCEPAPGTTHTSTVVKFAATYAMFVCERQFRYWNV